MPDHRRLIDPRALRLCAALLALAPIATPARTEAPLADPVRVGDLIGLPVVDGDNDLLGRVRGVARSDEGKIELLLALGGLFGFGERLVPIPIESVALAAAAITVLEVPPDRFQQTPTWYGHKSEPLAAAETVSINRR